MKTWVALLLGILIAIPFVAGIIWLEGYLLRSALSIFWDKANSYTVWDYALVIAVVQLLFGGSKTVVKECKQ